MRETAISQHLPFSLVLKAGLELFFVAFLTVLIVKDKM